MSYHRVLASRLRSLLIAGLDPSAIVSLPLAEVYVEREVVSTDVDDPLPAPLSDYARAPQARLLLCGPAGCGKSVALRHLALAAATAATGDADAPTSLADWPEPAPLPVLISSASVSAVVDSGADGWAVVEASLRHDSLEAHAAAVRRALELGAGLLLVDGAPAHLLELLSRAFPACRVVGALRAGATPPGFARLQLRPLDRARADELVARWLTVIARRNPATGLPPAQERIADLQGRLLPHDGVRSMADDPLALGLCVLADAAGHTLPAQRGLVYQRLAAQLLARDGPAPAPLAALEPLALELHAAHQTSAGLPRAVVESLLRDGLAAVGTPGVDPADLLARCLATDLLAPVAPLDEPWEVSQPTEEPADDLRYQMPRQTLREWLAAAALARPGELEARAAALWSDPHWAEVLALAVWERERAHASQGCSALQHLIAAGDAVLRQGAPERSVGDLASVRRAPTAQAGVGHTLLVASCLATIPAAREQHPHLWEEAQRRLLGVLGDPRSPLEERVRAGLLLGNLGDPRFEELPPPLTFVEGGPFVLGARTPGYEDEGPPQRIDLPAFRIGIYPVTNREYGRFLSANPGYPSPRYWFDPRFNAPSLPVVGVTWHDATAYAAWLTSALAMASLLPAGHVVRLALEAEWEKAATWAPRARSKRIFPWGDQWDAARANTADGRPGPDGRARWATTPVGCYPAGASAYGVHDMIGNVWEWTASEYVSYPGAPLPFHQRESYVLRGSAFNSTSANARASYRGSHLPPQYWRYNLGFRIVIGRPLPPRDS